MQLSRVGQSIGQTSCLEQLSKIELQHIYHETYGLGVDVKELKLTEVSRALHTHRDLGSQRAHAAHRQTRLAPVSYPPLAARHRPRRDQQQQRRWCLQQLKHGCSVRSQSPCCRQSCSKESGREACADPASSCGNAWRWNRSTAAEESEERVRSGYGVRMRTADVNGACAHTVLIVVIASQTVGGSRTEAVHSCRLSAAYPTVAAIPTSSVIKRSSPAPSPAETSWRQCSAARAGEHSLLHLLIRDVTRRRKVIGATFASHASSQPAGTCEELEHAPAQSN